MPKTILSIQSHVAYGYVGNRAATFPLQLMGYEVIAVNTVQFSNHTGYGSWTGDIFESRHIQDLVKGLKDCGALAKVDVVLSGYLGDITLGEVVINTVDYIRRSNPALTYCCDPVMGDTGKGLFVRETIPDFFCHTALPHASIITPNLFETEMLTGLTIRTLEEALKACYALHDKGPATILLTSLETEDTPEGYIRMLASGKDGRAFLVTTPKLSLDPAPNGAGDLTAALFTGHILAGDSLQEALEKTAASVFGVLRQTQQDGQRELALISGQKEINQPSQLFKAGIL